MQPIKAEDYPPRFFAKVEEFNRLLAERSDKEPGSEPHGVVVDRERRLEDLWEDLQAAAKIAMRCLCCGRTLEAGITKNDGIYASDGIFVVTDGNYGSRVLDDPGAFGEPLAFFVVCDWCLVERRNRIKAVSYQREVVRAHYTEVPKNENFLPPWSLR